MWNTRNVKNVRGEPGYGGHGPHVSTSRVLVLGSHPYYGPKPHNLIQCTSCYPHGRYYACHTGAPLYIGAALSSPILVLPVKRRHLLHGASSQHPARLHVMNAPPSCFYTGCSPGVMSSASCNRLPTPNLPLRFRRLAERIKRLSVLQRAPTA